MIDLILLMGYVDVVTIGVGPLFLSPLSEVRSLLDPRWLII